MSINSRLDLVSNKLSQQLSFLKEQQFNGELQVTSSRGIVWKLYFCLGRLFWVDGGEADRQSWRRYLQKYFWQLDRKDFTVLDRSSCGCDRYLVLADYANKNLIDLQQVKELIHTKIAEILFDILQQETYSSLDCSNSYICCNSDKIQSMLSKPLTLINPEEALQKTKLVWQDWIAKGLGLWSANSLVTMTCSQVSANNLYPELLKLINGKNTLRDIAFATEINVIELASYLLTYVNQGILQFIELTTFNERQDRGKKCEKISSGVCEIEFNSNADRQLPLIVAVNNNQEVSQSLATSIKEIGCHFVSIEESWQALPKLVSYHPDVILLAANMPVVNGYQIISQLRRVPHLKNTPIILIADSIADRLRAKLLGIPTINLDQKKDYILLFKIVKKIFLKNNNNKKNKIVMKYRGVIYVKNINKFKLSKLKSFSQNRRKKYLKTTNNIISDRCLSFDRDSESDLFNKKYDTVNYKV